MLPTVVLTRNESGDQGTIGTLNFLTHYVRTLELPWRENERKFSCIPRGIYRCNLVDSPSFGRVYLLDNVPERSAILIHPANFAGDTKLGWQSELEGCIAPCKKIGTLENRRMVPQMAGIASRSAFNFFMAAMQRSSFNLEVKGVVG